MCDAIDNARRGSGEAGAGGDRSRGLSDHTTTSAQFNLCKKGLAVDLHAPAGRAAAPAKRADIVVEGFRPGVAARLGLCGEALVVLNARLIVVSVSGFGQEGPWAGRSQSSIPTCAPAGQRLRRECLGEVRVGA